MKVTWLMAAALAVASSTVRAQEALPPSVPAQEAAPRAATPSSTADRRDDIKLLEGLLNAAVKNGADKLALQMRASEPGSLFVIDIGRTRGFDLQGYGVFFDVDVPMMKQSVLWSNRELTQQGLRTQLENYVQTLPPGPARDLAYNELQRMRQQGMRERLRSRPPRRSESTGWTAAVAESNLMAMAPDARTGPVRPERAVASKPSRRR